MQDVRIELEVMTEQEVNNVYSSLNSAGKGFSVGNDGQSLRAAAKEEGFTVWHSIGQGDNTTLMMSNDIGECFLMGDANGAWAVPVEMADLSLATLKV